MEAIPDLLVFDWVLSLGSTKDAAELLGIPQSSVSRRYRALAERFGLSLRRHRGELFVSSSSTNLRLLRELCHNLRMEQQLYRWSWQPQLLPMLQQIGRIGSGSTFINLEDPLWERRHEFMESRILDISFEICSDPSISLLGTVNPGMHLSIPPQHPLQGKTDQLSLDGARQYPIKSPTFALPTELTSQLLRDGFQLTSATESKDDRALDLRPGQPTTPTGLRLPYSLEAGWRVAPYSNDIVVNLSSLEQCVAPLNQAELCSPASTLR